MSYDDYDSNDNQLDDSYSIPAEPPQPARGKRRSWWPALLAEVRQHPNEWRQVNKTFAWSTVQQIASDLRRVHTRGSEKLRVRGVVPGDRFETRYAVDESVYVEFVSEDCDDAAADLPKARYFLWIKFIADEGKEG